MTDTDTPDKLTETQQLQVRGELIPEQARPVRFLKSGRALNITTGELASKGSNVIYHSVYWNFSDTTAKRIGQWLGARPVFDSN